MSKQQQKAATTKQEDLALRFACAHWEWMKQHDPANVVNGVRSGRLHVALRRVGIQAAAELQRRVNGGEQRAAVEAEIMGAYITPRRDGQPEYHSPEQARQLAEEFEESDEGAEFAGKSK